MRKEAEKKKDEYEVELRRIHAEKKKEYEKEVENKRRATERKKEKDDVEERRKEAEKKKKEEDDTTKTITSVVQDVILNETESQNTEGNGTKRGRKTTANKKKTIASLKIDAKLQKQLHKIGYSYKPRRNTRSMVKVDEKNYTEIVSKEEFEGKSSF
ncbi:UPF0329 protein ECU05_1680/ECU11_0050 [Spinacia oleracea]|uniref:UPF0329 protein ECU05_1680/ECU11_0050 n=1 Tax=Spinacia oleracea TaxID=3562 RepID=A0ABM3RLF3_SPIOL|nr:UPF0329 protein ECU05_1680/ECU11_0050-like [Spinacia oleracea]XP_056696449.1 UPF0329 protein ECU05_1680/ECU11_0050-like [Spinacia oleracea]